MLRRSIPLTPLGLCLAAACAFGQAVPAFNATGLVKPGDSVVSSQPLFFTTLMALRMTAFFGITGP